MINYVVGNAGSHKVFLFRCSYCVEYESGPPQRLERSFLLRTNNMTTAQEILMDFLEDRKSVKIENVEDLSSDPRFQATFLTTNFGRRLNESEFVY